MTGVSGPRSLSSLIIEALLERILTSCGAFAVPFVFGVVELIVAARLGGLDCGVAGSFPAALELVDVLLPFEWLPELSIVCDAPLSAS